MGCRSGLDSTATTAWCFSRSRLDRRWRDTLRVVSPETLLRWHRVADACFDHGGRPVPVLNLPRLFGYPD
jgi:hypothetical protein